MLMGQDAHTAYRLKPKAEMFPSAVKSAFTFEAFSVHELWQLINLHWKVSKDDWLTFWH